MQLNGHYLAGLTDGEGCFALEYRKDRQKNKNGKIREYFNWSVEFVIVLRSDDKELLLSVKETLQCGTVSVIEKLNQVRFSVQNTKDICERVIPFFNEYKMNGKKKYDFELWCEASKILNKYKTSPLNSRKGRQGFVKKPYDKSDLERLNSIRESMLTFKASRPKRYKWNQALMGERQALL